VSEPVDPGDFRLSGAARRRRRRQGRRSARGRRAALFAAAVIAVLAAVGALAVQVVDRPESLIGCRLAEERPHVVGADSFVYAANGSRLGTVPANRNREPVSVGEMSRWLPAATVAIEDRRFWHHGALDFRSIMRAAIADLEHRAFVQGGSTLTQQLVRDRYLAGESMNLGQKLKEACLAVQLARVWSKRRTLEAYLNTVYYGHHAYGAEAASQTYFSRRARDLTLTQAAVLAGLPQAPSVYDPFRNRAAARARRNEVLRAMRATGALSLDRYRAALARRVRLHPSDRYTRAPSTPFFDYVLRQLRARYGRWRARHGGLRIHTTLAPSLERLAQRAIAGWLHGPLGPGAALVAIDPRTGAIRAMAASAPGHKRLEFNLATQSHRQAGSAFKVFTLTAAIERGIPLSSVWHGPSLLTIPNRRCLTDNGPWVVHNFADETAGTMTLSQATAHSVNTIFAQVALQVGPDRIVAMAHRLGITSPLIPVCSITLGPEGVSPLEMTAAFATLADRGVRHRPVALTGQGSPGRRVLSQQVADKVSDALGGVVRGGTGTAANIGRPQAGKTGTAESFKDAWFCGYVPQLATCVWVGYPHAETPLLNIDGFPQVFGGSIPARIWHDFMGPALRGQPALPLHLPTAPR
jgi:penicillin-binding protein 1A